MISIANGLRISATNLDALRSGVIVGAFSKTFLVPDKAFALYPDLQIENSDLVTVDLWAECKSCENIDITFGIPKLSGLTALPIEELESIFQKRASIFLLVLRVYKLPNPIQVQYQSTGNFVPLSEIVAISDKLPILDDEQFQKIQNQSKDLELLIISDQSSDFFTTDDDLLEINSSLLNDSSSEPNDNLVDSNKSEKYHIPDLSWIQTISTLGDRSIEILEKKSNVQAGTDFENIVKKSLEFIGFTVDHVHAGGSGGLDLFCSKPFPLIGECKSGKNIPGNTVYELDNLSDDHLEDHIVADAQKLIIGAGKPTPQIQRRATRKNISIINPKSLQKLVELNHRYSGAINLIELRPYLIAGQADHKVDEYIQKVENELKLRSHVVGLVKNHHEDRISVESLFNIYPYSNPPQPTPKREDLRDILIELSSPLAGYLGRVKGNGENGDRFYYLRDLPI